MTPSPNEDQRFLAVVPARGGSKRIPGKNVRLLGGKPLIAWTIESALECDCFEQVLVSTDDEGIADIARQHGAFVPWMRPKELSTDAASTLGVLRHAASWFEKHYGPLEAVILLQPTSPFRAAESIRSAIQLYNSQPSGEGRGAVVSVSPVAHHPNWCFYLNSLKLEPVVDWASVYQQSQDMQEVYSLNGAIYVVPVNQIYESDVIVDKRSLAYVMSGIQHSLDIDDESDWQYAELLLEKLCL